MKVFRGFAYFVDFCRETSRRVRTRRARLVCVEMDSKGGACRGGGGLNTCFEQPVLAAPYSFSMALCEGIYCDAVFACFSPEALLSHQCLES